MNKYLLIPTSSGEHVYPVGESQPRCSYSLWLGWHEGVSHSVSFVRCILSSRSCSHFNLSSSEHILHPRFTPLCCSVICRMLPFSSHLHARPLRLCVLAFFQRLIQLIWSLFLPFTFKYDPSYLASVCLILFLFYSLLPC